MGLYLVVLGIGSFSQGYTKKFVKLTTQIGKLGKNRIIKQNSFISNFKIKYLVFLIGIYFVSVLIIFKSQLSSLPSFPIVLIIGTIIALVSAAFFGGILLMMLQNNEMLKEIRNNTKKKK